MKNKLLMLGLLSLLVGCGSNAASSSSKKGSTPIVSTPSVSMKDSTSSSSSIKVESSSSTTSSSKVSSTTTSTNSNVTTSSSHVSITPTNPTLNVVSDLKVQINERVNYLTLVSAYDTIDGNISHLINVTLPDGVTLENGNLVFATVGTYKIDFTVTNSSNLTSSGSINIEVYDIEAKDVDAPVILNYQNIRVKPGVMAYPLEGVIATDDFDGDVTNALVATYFAEGDATEGISFDIEGNYKVTITATDKAGNKSSVEINIEVNSEDLPTFVNMTEGIIMEYNCTVESSDITPYEGAISKEVKLKVKESQVYANFRLTFDEPIDLQNKVLSMYVKAGDNVKSNRISIDLRQGAEGVGQQQYILGETSGTGYAIEDKGNGWFKITMVVAQVWNLSSYVTDYIRLVFSNNDVTKTANMYIADFLIDDYKGEEIGGGNTGGEGGEVIDTISSEELTEIMEVRYNCVIEADKTVSHDGVQSSKIKAFDEYATTRLRINANLTGYMISFYYKTEASTIYKDRIYVQCKDTSDATINSEIQISKQDTLANGVTFTNADENGWMKVTIDCDAVGFSAAKTKDIVFKFRSLTGTVDGTTSYIGIAWIDELYILKKGA